MIEERPKELTENAFFPPEKERGSRAFGSKFSESQKKERGGEALDGKKRKIERKCQAAHRGGKVRLYLYR